MVLRGKYNGAKYLTEAWACVNTGVGERRIRGEVRAEALVDCTRVRMPDNDNRESDSVR